MGPSGQLQNVPECDWITVIAWLANGSPEALADRKVLFVGGPRDDVKLRVGSSAGLTPRNQRRNIGDNRTVGRELLRFPEPRDEET